MTTYLFTIWEGAGLVGPETAVAGRLVARGHRVEFIGDPSTEPAIRSAGAGFRAWDTAPHRMSARPEDDLARDWEVSNPLELMRRVRDRNLIGPAAGLARDTASAIDEIRPDVVVCDGYHLGPQLAGLASGLPTASLIPHPYPFPAKGIPPVGTGWARATTPVGRTRDRIGLRLLDRFWDARLDDLNAVRADLGLEPQARVWDLPASLDKQLVLTSAAFDFPGELPSNVTYTGPELGDPHWVGEWTEPPGDGPLLLVGLSSGYMAQEDLLRRILGAIEQSGVRAVVTTGPAIDPADFTAPSGVHLVRSAPHRQVLECADAVIGHGGHGTTIKALAAGVPQVVVPLGRDQADNGARVEYLGAGVRLPSRASSRSIATAVRRVLHDDVRASTVAARDRVLAEHDPNTAVRELEALAAARSGGGAGAVA